MIRIILTIVLFLFLTVVQISVVPQFGAAEFFLFPLLFLLFAVEFWPKGATYTAALTTGLSLAVFASAPLTAYVLACVMMILVTEFLYERFFTNRSLYGTLILTFLASLVFETTVLVATIFFSDATTIAFSESFRHIWHRAVGNTLLMIAVLSVLLGIGRIFRSWFFVRQSPRFS